MSIITDGLRSDKWRPFARQKLAMLKDLGLPAKNYAIDGYRISLSTMDDIDKARITAPPAIVATEIQYPDPETPGIGVQMLHYSEPFGATAYPAGPLGVPGDGQHRVLLTSTDGYYDAPGYGAIFPSSGDVYHASMGFWEQLSSPFSLVGLGIRYANYAANTLAPPGELFGTGSNSNSVGSWQAVVGGSIFSVDFRSDGTGANTFRVFAFGVNYRANITFDMDSAEVQTALGLMDAYPGVGRHLNARAAYLYPAPAAGVARVAVFAGPPEASDNLGGVYFFDFALHDKDETHSAKWLEWSYVGRCLTNWTGGGSPFSIAVGPVYSMVSQAHKSSIFPDGAGGVISIVRAPALPFDGTYSFTPAGAALMAPLTFPAEIADPQVWPVIFRGEGGAHLCLMEKIADSGPSTDPICEVVAVYGGSPSAWAALPMPAGELLAVRPIQVNPGRMVLLGLVWATDGSGTFAAQYVGDGGWKMLGKISPSRMRRPVVGLFGNHEFSGLAQKFPGSFPVTTWAGTHTYTGG